MSALLAERDVALRCEAGDAAWLVAGGARFAPDGALEVLVTDRDEPGSEHCLVLHPPVLALGVGCERGVGDRGAVRPGRDHARRARSRCRRDRLRGLARAEGGRARDPCAGGAARRAGPVLPGGEARGRGARLANPSELVFRATGCHGVAEGAALAAVGPEGALLVAKTRSARATLAIGRAAAPLDPARIGRPQGRLAIVGLGPGAAAWRTPEAETLLADAEDWVGYRGYLDLLGPRPGGAPARHAFALGEETARVQRALELAAAGRRVALISSGDAGIYGMAALVCEVLERADDPAWQRVALDDQPRASRRCRPRRRAPAPRSATTSARSRSPTC